MATDQKELDQIQKDILTILPRPGSRGMLKRDIMKILDFIADLRTGADVLLGIESGKILPRVINGEVCLCLPEHDPLIRPAPKRKGVRK